MNKETLLRISELTIGVAAIDERIIYIRKCIKQILYDKCTIDIFFNLHNEDRHEKNEAEKLAAVDDPYAMLSAMYMPGGLVGLINKREKQPPPCRTQFTASFTDGNSILVLNIFLEQELDRQRKLRVELNDLLTKHMIPVVENPIHSLHEEIQTNPHNS